MVDSQIVCPHCQQAMALDAISNGKCIRCAECGATLTPFELETPSGINALQKSFSADQFQLPGYTILRQVGQGGMGIVLEARQHSLDRKVAIKVLLPQLATDRIFENRFEREAAALARLSHPHIVAIYERGRLDDFIYFIMEYVEGRKGAAPEDLRQFIVNAAPLDSRTIQCLVLEIAGALAFAHEQGIVHRDVKPSNILVDRHGRTKLTDFGIAAVTNDASKLQLTGDNALMGTPFYMAPEQRRSATVVDQRADIYSLGVVLYEMLTGELPSGAYMPPSQACVGRESAWDTLTERALQPRKELRFSTMREFIGALDRVLVASSAQEGIGSFVAAPEKVGESFGQCPKCSQSVNSAEEFCRACGTPLWGACPLCSERHWQPDRFCAACGCDVPRQAKLTHYTKLAMSHVTSAQANGDFAARIKDAEQAGIAWAKALKLAPHDPMLRAGLQTSNELASRLLIEAGDTACTTREYGRALEHYSQAIEFGHCSPRVHERVQRILSLRNSTLEKARRFIADNQVDSASALLNGAAAQFSGEGEFERLLSECRSQRLRTKEAVQNQIPHLVKQRRLYELARLLEELERAGTHITGIDEYKRNLMHRLHSVDQVVAEAQKALHAGQYVYAVEQAKLALGAVADHPTAEQVLRVGEDRLNVAKHKREAVVSACREQRFFVARAELDSMTDQEIELTGLRETEGICRTRTARANRLLRLAAWVVCGAVLILISGKISSLLRTGMEAELPTSASRSERIGLGVHLLSTLVPQPLMGMGLLALLSVALCRRVPWSALMNGSVIMLVSSGFLFVFAIFVQKQVLGGTSPYLKLDNLSPQVASLFMAIFWAAEAAAVTLLTRTAIGFQRVPITGPSFFTSVIMGTITFATMSGYAAECRYLPAAFAVSGLIATIGATEFTRWAVLPAAGLLSAILEIGALRSGTQWYLDHRNLIGGGIIAIAAMLVARSKPWWSLITAAMSGPGLVTLNERLASVPAVPSLPLLLTFWLLLCGQITAQAREQVDFCWYIADRCAAMRRARFATVDRLEVRVAQE